MRQHRYAVDERACERANVRACLWICGSGMRVQECEQTRPMPIHDTYTVPHTFTYISRDFNLRSDHIAHHGHTQKGL